MVHDHVLRRKRPHETATITRDTGADSPRAVYLRPAVETVRAGLNVAMNSARPCAQAHTAHTAHTAHAGARIRNVRDWCNRRAAKNRRRIEREVRRVSARYAMALAAIYSPGEARYRGASNGEDALTIHEAVSICLLGRIEDLYRVHSPKFSKAIGSYER